MDIVQKEQARKKRTLAATIGVGVVVVGLYVGVVVFTKPNDADTNVGQNSAPPVAVPTPVGAIASFRDGTYAATGIYAIPVGEEHVDVMISVSQGIVSDVEVKFNAKVKTSEFYQAQFAEGYKQYVVGKKLDEVKLIKVSGSSLTPKGFNDALEQIKAQAKI